MIYQIVFHDGKTLDGLTKDQASKLSTINGMVEIEIDGVSHYVNTSSIARVVPIEKRQWASDRVAKELGQVKEQKKLA